MKPIFFAAITTSGAFIVGLATGFFLSLVMWPFLLFALMEPIK